MTRRGKNVIIVIQGDDKASNVMDKVKLGLKDFESSAKRSNLSLANLRGTYIAATAAVTGFTAAIAKLTSLAAEQERVERRLQFAVKAAGLEVATTTTHLKEYASSLQKMTGYGDEAIIPVQTLLIQLGQLSGETLDRATQATLDFSVAMGIDLRSAATLVAKAATGYTSALTRYGITVDENIPKTEQFAAVLGKMESLFGGTAQSDLDTFTGSMRSLKSSLGDLGEVLADPLLPGLRDLNVVIQTMTDKATTLVESKGFGALMTVLSFGLGGSQVRKGLEEQLRNTELWKLMNVDFVTEADNVRQPAGPGRTAAPVGGPGDGAAAAPFTPLMAAAVMEAEQARMDEITEGRLQIQEEQLQREAELRQARIDEIIREKEAEEQAEMEKTETLLALQESRMQAKQAEIELQQQAIEATRMGFEAIATAFPKFKGAAIAEATIRGGVAFMNALSVQPWWVGLAQAGIAVAKTKSAIDNIKKTGISTGGGTGSYTYGGATATVPATPAQASTDISIQLPSGSGYTSEDMATIMENSLGKIIESQGGQVGNIRVLYERN